MTNEMLKLSHVATGSDICKSDCYDSFHQSNAVNVFQNVCLF